ncbi:MAG: sulfurase [Pseudomonadota bacterium]
MAILKPTSLIGRVEGIFVNREGGDSSAFAGVDRLQATFAGLEGDAYASLTRPACVRTKRQYTPGTNIRNVRQITIVSAEELELIGEAMDLPEPVHPTWMRANLVVSGLPDFTRIPPSSRLILEGGASLVVDMENEACSFPGDLIDRVHPGRGKFFVKAAWGRRGVTAWVEREGDLWKGADVTLHIPPQRLYAPAQPADEV